MTNIKYTTNDSALLNRQVGPRIDTGYAVSFPNVSANDKTNWNVQLIKLNKKYLNLWVDSASVDFSLSGNTGQSRYKREFYPHSFNEPTLVMTGRMPNQREYNKLAAFVRESHSEALNVNRNYNEKSGGTKPFPTVTLIMKSNNQQKGQPRNQKGGHMGMKLEGYIKSIAAGNQKFDFAPEFQIQFIVAASDGTVGIYEDTLDSGSQIMSWMTLFKENHFSALSGDQIRKQIHQQPGATQTNPSGLTPSTTTSTLTTPVNNNQP